MLWSLVESAERGETAAPEKVDGTSFVNDTESLDVEFTRPMCRCSSVVQYVNGPVEQVSSWACGYKGLKSLMLLDMQV